MSYNVSAKILAAGIFAILVLLNPSMFLPTSAFASSHAPPLISALDGNSKYIPNGGSTNSNSVVFKFRSVDYVATQTKCSLDNSQFSSCKDTLTFNNLILGDHTFRVQVTDSNGQTITKSFSWEITTAPQGSPKITSAPLALTSVHSSSVNVGIIGGTTLTQSFCDDNFNDANDIQNGGCIPINDTSFKIFHFVPISVPLTQSSFNGLDTIVLNVVSPQISCNLSVLSDSNKTAIVNFMLNGGKLIIYDSECTPTEDYSWLPASVRFSTNNPGPTGNFGGAAVIKENNTLSSNKAGDPYEVDLGPPNPDGTSTGLCPNADACQDANVMTTLASGLCTDIQDTNFNLVSGAVHAYSKDGSVGNGILIYAGWDMDFSEASDTPSVTQPGVFAKLFFQELKQPWNPSGLPCGAPVQATSGRFFQSAQIPVENPQYLDVNNVTHKVYVSNGTMSDNFGNVTVIDGNPAHSSTVNTILHVIKNIGVNPLGVAVDFVNNMVFVAMNGLGGGFNVINSNTDQVTSTSSGLGTSTGIATDPTLSRAYETLTGANQVQLISHGSSGHQTAVNSGPYGVAINAQDHYGYVTNGTFPGSVTVLDELTRFSGTADAAVGVTTVGNSPHGIAINPITNMTYVANSIDSTISVLNANVLPPTLENVISLPFGFNPEGVAINPRTNIVYVTGFSVNLVAIINGSSGTVIQEVPVGTNPLGVTVDVSTNRAYVTNSGSNSVSVIMESCIPPSSGTWTILDSCIIAGHVTPPGKIIVTNKAQVTIQNGGWLDEKLNLNNIKIKSGSSFLIKSGGKLS